MSLYAVDDIDDALDATRSLLWPVDLRRWGALAAVVFFVGGVGGTNPLQFTGGGSGDTPEPSGGPTAPEAVSQVATPELAVIGAVVAAVLVVGLVFTFVGAVMEFVFVESLRQESVAIRRYWRQHWRRGLRLFGFRLLLGVVGFGTVGLLLAAVFAPLLLGVGAASLALLAIAIPAGVVVGIVTGLVGGFTTSFVVPIMLLEDCGVLAGWRRFWPTLTGQWKQYAAYAVLGFVLQIAGGIVAGLATAVGGVVVAVPLGVVGLAGVGLLAVSQPAGWVVVGVAVVLFVLSLVVLGLLAAVPVQTFRRYYSLLVLGDTEGEFDPIPERRRRLRRPDVEEDA